MAAFHRERGAGPRYRCIDARCVTGPPLITPRGLFMGRKGRKEGVVRKGRKGGWMEDRQVKGSVGDGLTKFTLCLVIKQNEHCILQPHGARHQTA